MPDLCDDNRFELIEVYKQKLIESTNIESSPEEMAVLDDILFRFWQMGWLDKLETIQSNGNNVPTTDLISRHAAIDACLSCLQGENTLVECPDECDAVVYGLVELIEQLPSAQPDMSGYSDRLWKAAYERGKREAEPERLIDRAELFNRLAGVHTMEEVYAVIQGIDRGIKP